MWLFTRNGIGKGLRIKKAWVSVVVLSLTWSESSGKSIHLSMFPFLHIKWGWRYLLYSATFPRSWDHNMKLVIGAHCGNVNATTVNLRTSCIFHVWGQVGPWNISLETPKEQGNFSFAPSVSYPSCCALQILTKNYLQKKLKERRNKWCTQT